MLLLVAVAFLIIFPPHDKCGFSGGEANSELNTVMIINYLYIQYQYQSGQHKKGLISRTLHI